MNTTELKKGLQEKERQLLADIARIEGDARNSREAEVQDHMDKVVSSEDKENLFQETSSEWTVLTQVRAALERLANGTYGKCADCGRQIEPNRLKAIPWTPYCLEDQLRHDDESARRSGGPTL
jgi:RNA polymerase-binding transcription factor